VNEIRCRRLALQGGDPACTSGVAPCSRFRADETGYTSWTTAACPPIASSATSLIRRFVPHSLAARASVAISVVFLLAIAARATFDIARALNFRTVAEGIESRPQANFLAELGCDVFQGFHCAKPMPAREFLALAKSAAIHLFPRPAVDASAA